MIREQLHPALVWICAEDGTPFGAGALVGIQRAGYRTTTAIHDDGRRSVASAGQNPDVQLLFGRSDGMRQVCEPSDTFLVVDRRSTAIADIRVSQSGAMTVTDGFGPTWRVDPQQESGARQVASSGRPVRGASVGGQR